MAMRVTCKKLTLDVDVDVRDVMCGMSMCGGHALECVQLRMWRVYLEAMFSRVVFRQCGSHFAVFCATQPFGSESLTEFQACATNDVTLGNIRMRPQTLPAGGNYRWSPAVAPLVRCNASLVIRQGAWLEARRHWSDARQLGQQGRRHWSEAWRLWLDAGHLWSSARAQLVTSRAPLVM